METAQALRRINAFRLIREEHGVTVKSDAQFFRMPVGINVRVGKHLRRREPRRQRLAHVIGIGREKKMRPQRIKKRIGRPAAGKYAAPEFQAIFFRRTENAQTGHRIVA